MPQAAMAFGGNGEAMRIKGAIFDLDGTLMDSMFIWDTIGADYLISRGIIPEEGLNEIFKKKSLVQAAQYYQDNYGITDSIPTIMEGVNGMIDHLYSQKITIKKGVLPLLEKFKEKGVEMCIATATDRHLVEAALKHNGIYEYFSHILTCTEIGFGKDSPEIFEKALEKLETEKTETLVFEDALHAIETAKHSGFQVVGIYDESSWEDQEKIKELSDYYTVSLENWGEDYD